MRPKSTLDLATCRHHDGGAPSRGVVHVGVLVPWANRVVEDELPRLCPDGVVLHYARLVPPCQTTVLDETFLDGLRAAVPAAVASLSRLPLEGVLLACTSEGFTRTEDERIVSAFDTLTTGLTRLDAKRIVLATPYPEPITQREVDAFTGRGFEVTAHASLGRDDGYPDVAPAEITSLVAGIDTRALAGADALVLSCTGWATLGVITYLEQDLGMPVLSSNVAMAIHATTLGRAEQR